MQPFEPMYYGEEQFEVPLDPADVAAELHENPVELEPGSTEELIRRALDNPIGSAPLSEIVKPGEKVCVVISDITRMWQRPDVYMPILIEVLNAAGIADEDITILSATGTHRTQSEEEHERLVTKDICRRIGVIDHDSKDEAHLRYVGTTGRGTPVRLDTRALDADRLILTGGATFHFLAGYGGGRKNVVPGVAAYDTVMKNHSLALNPGLGNGCNPGARSANMTPSNPFHADLLECAAFAHPDFLLNVVCDSEQNIVGAYAGDYIEAHKAACGLVKDMFLVDIDEKAPLVIASAGGFPKDINFYQSSKTLFNALDAAAPGGTIIIVTKCNEGVGEPNCARIIKNYPTLLEKEKSLREDFSIGAFVGYAFSEYAEKYNLILVTDIPQEAFGACSVHAVKTLEAALEKAKALNGGTLPTPAILMPHGANTLPKTEEA